MCAQFVRTKHDLGFLRTDGTTTVGLRIARDKNNQPIYRSYDDEYLPQQQISGTPGYSNLPPEKELALVRSDWRAGFGQQYDDVEKKYYKSGNADGRFKNQFILGPAVTSITAPTTPATTIVNADMELTTGWAVNYRDDAQKHGGTYSWKLTTGSAGELSEDYQDLTWSTQFQNWSFTFTCWVKPGSGAVPTNSRIAINDGVTTTSSEIHSGADAWEQLTVTKVLANAATRLRLILHVDGGSNRVAYFDDAAITGGGLTFGVCKSIVTFNSLEYFGIGQGLFKLNGTGDGFTWVKTFDASITDMDIFGANLYIALGTSNEYWYMNTSESFTESNAAVTGFKYFCTVKGTADTFWGVDGAATIRSTTNPANGGTAWSSQKTVDSSTYSICELITRGNILYIRKQDRCFYLDSSSNVQVLVQETEYLSSSLDGNKSATFLDDVFMQWGAQSLLWWDTSAATFSWVSPAKYVTGLAAFNGVVQALAADEEYLFACCDNGTLAEILAGRNEDIDGVTDWRWHPLRTITITGVQTAKVSSVYAKRLWIASTTAAEAIQWIPLTTQYGSIEADTNYRYVSGGSFDSSWHHLNFKGDTKAFIKITLTQSQNTADIYWRAVYKKLGDTSWTAIGNFTAGTATETKYIPVDGSSNNPKSTMMQFEFLGYTNDLTVSPVLLSYDVRAILYPTNRRIIEVEVLAEDEYKLIDGTTESGQAATIKAAIEEARAATWPVTFYDLSWAGSGDTLYAKFLPTVCQPITKQISPTKIERHYLLKLQVVPLS